MALLRIMSVLGLTLATLVSLAYGDPLIGEFPRLYENFMSIFESLGGRRYMEAIQNGEEVNMQQDYTALNNFFGECLREIVGSDLPFLRPDIRNGYDEIEACTPNPVIPPNLPTASCGPNQLTFTQAVNNAENSDFRYGFDGPGNLQGTWWIKNVFNTPAAPNNATRGAVLMNFARSLDPFPLSPGAVLPPDEDGINFKIRVAGDRTFAFATNGDAGPVDADSAFEQTIRQDLIYDYAQQAGFDPFNPEGPPIENANQFFIYPTFKVPGFPCVRIKFRPCLAFIYAMDMKIAAADAVLYPGSKIWDVTIKQFDATLASFQYIQIVDGTGAPISSAFNAFLTEQQSNPDPSTIFFRGLDDDQPFVPCGGGV